MRTKRTKREKERQKYDRARECVIIYAFFSPAPLFVVLIG